jgi:hypothetical protein
LVKISNLSAIGAGLGAGSDLAHWVAHLPSLVPSPADAARAYLPWLKVFGGLHDIVGYRTTIYSNDGVVGPFGADIAMGAPVVSAWLTELASDSEYTGDPSALVTAQRAPQPLGRASTLSVCGHADDTIYDTSPLPAATCLQSWWLAN